MSPEIRNLLRQGCDLLSVESDALKSGISIGDDVSQDPEDQHTRDAIAEIEGWIACVGRVLGEASTDLSPHTLREIEEADADRRKA